MGLLEKIIIEKQVLISEITDEIDIEKLPEDTVIVLDEEFPELDDAYWEDD